MIQTNKDRKAVVAVENRGGRTVDDVIRVSTEISL